MYVCLYALHVYIIYVYVFKPSVHISISIVSSIYTHLVHLLVDNNHSRVQRSPAFSIVSISTCMSISSRMVIMDTHTYILTQRVLLLVDRNYRSYNGHTHLYIDAARAPPRRPQLLARPIIDIHTYVFTHLVLLLVDNDHSRVQRSPARFEPVLRQLGRRRLVYL